MKGAVSREGLVHFCVFPEPRMHILLHGNSEKETNFTPQLPADHVGCLCTHQMGFNFRPPSSLCVCQGASCCASRRSKCPPTLRFLTLASEKMERYLRVSTHFRSSSIRFCFSDKPFLAILAKETFLSCLDLGITLQPHEAEGSVSCRKTNFIQMKRQWRAPNPTKFHLS